jgi:putative transposase
MKIEINVPEVVSLFKEIRCQSEKIFEMIRLNIQEMVGKRVCTVSNLKR